MGAALVGIVVGLVVGLTSMGGGALLTPALVYVLGVPPSVAVGSDVLIASLTKLVGGGAYAIRREVHWPLVLRLAIGSIPGAIVGKSLLGLFPGNAADKFIIYGLSVALLLAAAFTVQRLLWPPAQTTREMPRALTVILLGFLTGFVVTITSVGSGSLLMVVLLRIVPLRLPKLVGTDLVHALILSLVATVLHARTGWVDLHLAGSVLIGSIPGVLIGARLARTLPERPVRAALAGVLALIGVTLAVQGPNSHGPVRARPVIAAVSEVAR